MDVFKNHVTTVLDFLIEHEYSEHSIRCYKKAFEALEVYMESNGITYTPTWGSEVIAQKDPVPFGTEISALHSALIQKINSVYLTGEVSGVMVSPRKCYSTLRLCGLFSDCLERFTKHISTVFTDSQTENTKRRCSLFLKYLQHMDKEQLCDLTYEDLHTYHSVELKHLRPNSRIMEEGGICHFLRFLNEEKIIPDSYAQYMHELETDTFIDIDSFTTHELESLRTETQESISLPEFCKIKASLITKGKEVGYVRGYLDIMDRVARKLELFLDIYELDYSPDLANVWLNNARTKEVMGTSTWITARRVIFLINTYISAGAFGFAKTLPRSISGMDCLPGWMFQPLMDYANLRAKEKIDDDTVKNDIYSILRFYRYLLQNKVSSFAEITSDLLVAFNLYDEHKSSEGKNACNARIRSFLRYLFRQGIIDNTHLSQVLSYAAIEQETIVTVLEPAEIETIRNYIVNAVTPLQLQDSAVMLLGTEMGIRGCDIVRLCVSDIDFKNKTVRFIQDKTDVEVELAMPVAVGNAIYKYLKYARPARTDSPFLFLSQTAPHKAFTRNICMTALKRILPERSKPGSGFHVTRKTFSTSKLQKGIIPEQISSAMGQRTVKSLTPYLSLDTERLSMCALSLESLGLSVKGGIQ